MKKLHKTLLDVMFDYLFSTERTKTHGAEHRRNKVKSRAQPLYVAGYYLDYKNSRLSFHTLVEEIKKTSLLDPEDKLNLVSQLKEQSSTWKVMILTSI